MQYTPDFEIPSSVRDIAGKSLEQARDAYGRLVESARQAQEMLAKSGEVIAAGAKEANERMLAFAENNTKASFDAATRLAKARDLKEIMEIQTAFARAQIESYTAQAQELSGIVAVAAAKAQPSQAA